MDRILNDIRSGALALVTRILALLAAATAFFTYKGASIGAERFSDKAGATVFAIGSGAAIYLFWHFAVKFAPDLKDPRAKRFALSLIGAGCLLFLGLSSSFNVAGLAGEDALNKHLSVYVGGQEETVNAQFRQSRLVDGIDVDIRGEASRYKMAAEDEFKTGAYSGEPGTGAVHTALKNIQGRLEVLAQEADKFLQERDRLSRKTQGRLEKIRKLASSERSIAERERAIARESDALRIELARMDARRLAESVARTLEMLSREADIQSNFSKDQTTARQQRAALAKLRSDIEHTADRLGEFIDQATADDVPQIESFERISAVRAVLVYWYNYIPFWVGGIVLDIAPLSIVLFLMIASTSRTQEELTIARLKDRRVGDLVDDEISKQVIRSASADAKTLKRILDVLLGRKGDDDAD